MAIKIFCSIFTIAMVFVVPNFSYSYDNYSDKFESCIKNAASTMTIVDCYSAEIKRQDRRLNENYNELMNVLPREKKEKLRSDERRWIAKRDAEVARQANSGGTMARVRANAAFLEMTAERADELEDLLDEAD